MKYKNLMDAMTHFFCQMKSDPFELISLKVKAQKAHKKLLLNG